MKSLPYLKDYLEYLTENDYGKSTIESYHYGLNNFGNFLRKHNINLQILKLLDINNFVCTLKNSKVSNTINLYLYGLKSYFSFLIKDKNTTLNFKIGEIKIIKTNRRTRQEPNIKQVNKILKNLENKESLIALRDHVIIKLIIKTGMRISELIKIEKNNIIKNEIILDKNKYILDNELYELINKLRGKSNHQIAYLLIPYSKNIKNRNNHITIRSLERIIKKYFPNYSYNDLKLVYYRFLCEKLPDIIKVNKHENHNKINLEKIEKII